MNATTDHGLRTTGLACPESAERDPELTYLSRFLAWLGVPAPFVSNPVHVRVVWVERTGGYYAYTLEPANDAARQLLGATGNGHFATPADARRRAVWNCWEVVEDQETGDRRQETERISSASHTGT